MDRQRFQKTQQIFFMQAKAPRRCGALAIARLQRKRPDLRIQDRNAELQICASEASHKRAAFGD
jgi:hypothetical protein